MLGKTAELLSADGRNIQLSGTLRFPYFRRAGIVDLPVFLWLCLSGSRQDKKGGGKGACGRMIFLGGCRMRKGMICLWKMQRYKFSRNGDLL